MHETFDVVIVGAGYIGVSVAYHLCAAGLKTALLDSGPVAAGASRANFGNIQIQDMELGKSRDLIRLARSKFANLEQELGRTVGLRSLGGLVLIENEIQWSIMESRLRVLRSEGVRSELVPADRLHEIEPQLSAEGLLGGLYNPEEGQLDPFQLIWAYLVSARQHGLEEFYFHEVTEFLVEGNHVRGVKTPAGTVEAGKVILCTGAGTRQLGRLLGRDWGIRYILGQAMVTEPTGPTLRSHISSASFFEQEANGSAKEVNVGLAMSQSPHGHLLLGEAMVKGQLTDRVVPAFSLPSIAAHILRFFPSFEHLRVLRGWSTAVGLTLDSRPWLGPVPGVEGLIIATAFRSTVIVTPLVGELVRQLVLNGDCDLPIAPFLPERTTDEPPE